MNVEIRELPEMRAGIVHHTGPYMKIGGAFEKLGKLAGRAGLFEKAGHTMIGIYRDDPEATPLDELRSAAAITLTDDEALPEGLEEERISGGRYAVLVHTGSYEGLPGAWGQFMSEWLPSSGETPADGPSLEIYVNDPSTTPQDELKTELCMPLA